MAGCILVVEDDAVLRLMCTRALARAGYEVLAACDGSEGLEVFEREGDRIELVVADVVMPHLSGDAMACRMLERRPGLRILFMTGAEHVELPLHEGQVNLMPKPFAYDVLLQAVQKLLGPVAVRGQSV